MTVKVPANGTSIEKPISSRCTRPTAAHLLILVLALLFLSAADSLAQDAGRLPYQDPSLSANDRARDLVGRMSLEEKVSQMQNHSVAIPRLGVPEYNWWNEALHGVARAGYATVFPQAIGLAATWDEALQRQIGDVVSTEARIKNAEALSAGDHRIYRGLTFWSPNINIFRDPRWGRGQETYGEDPFLTGRMGVAYVEGLQGPDDRFLKVVATPKHFAVHSGPEQLRHTFDAEISRHDLEDTYLPAFRATVMEAQAGSVMCAYNSLFHQPACMNDVLLGESLRNAWKFGGYVVSDCGAIGDIANGHKAAGDVAAASAAAVRAGTDLDCGTEYAELPSAVQRGLITTQEIDAAAIRLFTARFKLGLFDPPATVHWTSLPQSQLDSQQHRKLALEAARESIVLLKNDRATLPFAANVHNIAVIGPDADQREVLVGNYNGTPSSYVTVLDGLRLLSKSINVDYAQGSLLAEGLAGTVPGYLLHPATDSNVRGLRAEIFSNTQFAGKPASTRIDEHLDFDARQVGAAPGLPFHGYSIRWTGTLIPDFDGAIALGTRRGQCWDCGSPDTIRLFVNGTLWTEDPGSSREDIIFTRSIPVLRGKPLDLRVEYVNTSGEGTAKLVWIPPAEALRKNAVAAAQHADEVVMVLGISPQVEGEEMPIKIDGFNGGDRTNLDLPAPQRELFEAVASTGKPITVVLMNGSALALDALKKAGAIVEAWYPGEQGGMAVAQVLSGTYNPGGRLPITFYRATNQLPPFEDYAMRGRTYRYFEGEPSYTFGYGLSYTHFTYTGLKLETPAVTAGQPLNLSIDVKNTGQVAGDEVVQAYLTPPQGPDTPLRWLAGFQRIHLEPQESRSVHFEIAPRSLSLVDADGSRAIAPGKYSVWVGGGQPLPNVTGQRQDFMIKGPPLPLPR